MIVNVPSNHVVKDPCLYREFLDITIVPNIHC